MIKLYINDAAAKAHCAIVRPIIQKRIKRILGSGIVKNKRRIHISSGFENFLQGLSQETRLNFLITAGPDKLQGLVAKFWSTRANIFVPNHDENIVLRNIFITSCYDSDKFSKFDFIKNLSIDTCPYCNRNYIYYLTRASKIKPQIDHFYPQSQYPILGISFYNLIPSCQTCNGFGAKEEKDPDVVNLVNPYLLEKDSFKFTCKIKSINYLNPLHDKKSVEVRFSKKQEGHLDVFKLEELYDQHSDHVIELIVKSKVAYSKQYRKYLSEYKGLKFSDDELDRMILGNYARDSEVHKRPLAKMYQDIGRELGLLK